MTRVIVVEDHTLLRESVCRWLDASTDLRVVATADAGAPVIGLVEAHDPHIVVLDIGLPDMDGIAVGSEIRRRSPGTRLVYLTMHDDDATIREVLRLRADAFVLKSEPPSRLTEALRVVASGGTFLSDSIASRIEQARRAAGDGTRAGTDIVGAVPTAGHAPADVADVIRDVDADVADVIAQLGRLVDSPSLRRRIEEIAQDQRGRLEVLRAPFQQLTAREREVLVGLIQGKSAPQIAEDAVVSAATVRTQIRAVLLKLGVHSQLEAVALARQARWPDGISLPVSALYSG